MSKNLQIQVESEVRYYIKDCGECGFGLDGKAFESENEACNYARDYKWVAYRTFTGGPTQNRCPACQVKQKQNKIQEKIDEIDEKLRKICGHVACNHQIFSEKNLTRGEADCDCQCHKNALKLWRRKKALETEKQKVKL